QRISSSSGSRCMHRCHRCARNRTETSAEPVEEHELFQERHEGSTIRYLFEEGIFALPIVYPMVAKEKARIRTIMNAALTIDDLDFAINAFAKVGKELHII